MKQASTQERTEQILYDILGGAKQRSRAKVEYLNDSDVWFELEDVADIAVSFSSRDIRRNSYLLIPPAGQLNLQIINKNDKYTLGHGGPFDGVIRRNRKVRVYFGHVLPGEIENVFNDDLTVGNFYHTQLDSGDLKININNTETPDPEFHTYNSIHYNQINYQIPGYFKSRVIDLGEGKDTLEKMEVYASQGNKLLLQYKNANSSDMDVDWSDLISLSAGLNEITLSPNNKQYFQYRILFDVATWDDTVYFNEVKVYYDSEAVEWFLQGIFFLEDPTYRVGLNDRTINIIGRDLFKKAIEQKITTKLFSSGETINNILQWLSDYLVWTSTSFVANTIVISQDISWEDKSVAEILNDILLYIQKDGDYRLFISSEGVLKLVKKLTELNADWLVDYRYHDTNLTRDLKSIKMIQEVRCQETELSIGPEVLIGNYTGTSTGEVVLAYGADHVNIRWVDNTGNVTRESGRSKEELKLLVPTSESYDIDVYGTLVSSGVGDIAGNSTDQSKEKIGTREKFTIPLISDEDEAKEIADVLAGYWQEPIENIKVDLPLNVLVELNDRYLVWDRYTLLTNLFNNISMSHRFPSRTTTLTLEDNADEFEPYIWDRNGSSRGSLDISFDIGMIWDWDLGPEIDEDPNDYDNLKEVQFYL